jgi:hypothetical protein
MNIACIAEVRNKYGVLVGNPEGKRLFARTRRRWEIKIKGMGWEAMDCISVQTVRSGGPRHVNTVMNFFAEFVHCC